MEIPLKVGEILTILNELNIKDITLKSTMGSYPLEIENNKSKRPIVISNRYYISKDLVDQFDQSRLNRLNLFKDELQDEIEYLRKSNTENAQFRAKLLIDVLKKLD